MIEVLEHIEPDEIDNLISLFSKRVSSIVLTTPNGDFYPYHPRTKEERSGFHLWHYKEDELKDLFLRHYKFVNIFGCVREPNICIADQVLNTGQQVIAGPVGLHLGYLLFATNSIQWNDALLSC